VNAVFHGHAHRGAPEGRTKGAAPVYNVAMPVLTAAFPDRPPFCRWLSALQHLRRWPPAIRY